MMGLPVNDDVRAEIASATLILPPPSISTARNPGEALPKEEARSSGAEKRFDIVVPQGIRAYQDNTAPGKHPVTTGEATAALRAFLASFGISRGEQGDLLVEQLLAGAHGYQRHHPQISLAECAIDLAEKQFEAWLALVLADALEAGQSPLAIGRAAFLACGGPTLWHDLVLVHDKLPDRFLDEMRAAMPPLAPLPAPASMEAQPLDSWSIAEVGRGALDFLSVALAWSSSARPLFAASIKLVKSRP